MSRSTDTATPTPPAPTDEPRSGQLFAVSGPSGVGKTVLCNRIRARLPQLVYSVSATSRPPRGAEAEGVDYFFHSREQMQAMIAAGELAEWAEVHGNFYGTPRRFIDDHRRAGRSLLLNIDVNGARQLRHAYPDVWLIFIEPPSLTELEARLRARSLDDEAAVQRRLANARTELAARTEYRYVLINDDLERTTAELEAIIRHHLQAGAGGG